MPYYRYTIDGEETPWPGKLPEGVSSGPSAAPSNPQLTSADIQTLQDSGQQSLLNNIQAAYSYAQEPMQAVQTTTTTPPYPGGGTAIPESVASAWRAGNRIPFDNWVNGLNTYPWGFFTWSDQIIEAMVNSPSPIIEPFGGRIEYLPTGQNVYIDLTYAGYQTQTPSIPGTTIEDTGITNTGTKTGTMPFPAIPDVIGTTTTAVQQAIGQPLQAAQQAVGQLQGQVQGQIDYQLAQAAIPLPRIQQRIDANIVNTMGEVYQASYPIGLGIPTPEQIISGEPVYSPYGIGADIPYETPTPTPSPEGYQAAYTSLPPTTPPGVTCPAPVVQCPPPPNINFAPNVIVNIPKPDGTNVSVNVQPPAPTTEEYTPPVEESSPTVIVPITIEPTPSPTPTPEPEPEPTPTPVPTPTPEKPIKEAPLSLPNSVLPLETDPWGTGVPCLGSPTKLDANLNQLWAAFGWSQVKPGEYRPPAYINPDNYPAGFKWLGSFLMNVEGMLIDSTAKTFGASLPIANNFGDFLAIAVGGFVQNWVGAPVLQFMQSNIYNINYNNPQRIPSEAEVVSLYLSGEINEQTMRCLVRANGSYDTWYGLIANANRTKLTNDQLIQLRRRNIIDDQTTNKLMRGNGVIDEQEQLWMYKASEAIPSVSDIVRFMVRDADDDTIAGKYGTDAKLTTKYGQQLQSWAKGQGITDEVMKYYWRSHWEIPSNTALFEMLHRLRPNRRSSPVPADAVVTKDDVLDALVVNDVLPYWAKRLVEISYKPLTRTDTQRAYFIDAISEDELFDSYMDLGYNADNATRLVKFTNQLKAKRKQISGGTERPTSVLKYYKNWLIGDTEARQRLKNSGLSDNAANEALQIAANQRKNDSQLACIKGIKAQYKRFIIDDVEARRDLTAIGVAIENITPLVAQWNCERANKPKELTAAQVCNAYKNLLIDKQEYYRRLKAIGYQEDEAGILLEICAAGKGNKNAPAGVTTGVKKVVDTVAQTAAARAVTQAALDALATGN